MMLSAKLDQWAAFFALSKTSSDKRTTHNDKRLAPRSPSRLAMALKRSSLPPARVTSDVKSPNSPISRKRRRPYFSVYDELEPQHTPEKKVRFDLTQNDIREFETETPARPQAKNVKAGVTWVDHRPGDSLFMSGGVADPSPKSRHDCTPCTPRIHVKDDETVATFDLAAAVTAMPFKIVTKMDLEGLNIFEEDFPEDAIGDDFNTTYLGIQRAIEDTEEIVLCNNADSLSYDEILLGQLARRAGTCLGMKRVEYVEDMVPVVGEGDEGFDEEYWLMVWSKGSFWEGLSAATKDAIWEEEEEQEDGYWRG